MSEKTLTLSLDRREQILEAAMACFAECGFHQTSMHDISARAGISVGLIYRYFKSKEEMIAALAAEHKKDIASLLERAADAPTLLEAMEVIFTSHCCARSPHILSAFVVDLFAEASRNRRVAKIVRNVMRTKAAGVAALIARSPELKKAKSGLDAQAIAEMIFALNDGTMMRSVLSPANVSVSQQREGQLKIARTLWHLLFSHTSHGNGHR